MLRKSAFAGMWKHRRRKRNCAFYSSSPNHRPNHCRRNIVSTNIAITDHARRGQLDVARNLFDEMLERSVVSWNAMISGYSRRGKYGAAIDLVSDMHRSHTKLNETTFSSVLSACARLPSLRDGKQIHCLVVKSGHEDFELVGSALLYFYANCFEIEETKRLFDVLRERNELLWSLMLVGYVQNNLMSDALHLFDKMPRRNVVDWTSLISGYSKSSGENEKALELFRSMRSGNEAEPNEFTLDSVLRACANMNDLNQGKSIHGIVIRSGFELEHSINGALIDFYCKCGSIDDAKKIYNNVIHPCLTDSNTLIAGLITVGRIEEAESVLDGMIETSPVSHNLMIKGYAMSGRIEDSKRLFIQMPQKIISSSNTMISVYARNGEIDKAIEIFESTKDEHEQSSVTWNSMISGYIHNDQHENAIKLYITMRRTSIDQTRSTFSALFHACSCIGSLQQGQILHTHLSKTPFESNVYVGTALIDMYSKCGSINDAQASFIAISRPNVATWTAMINAYAHHGLAQQAISTLDRMLNQGVKPNSATLVGVLSGCNHSGLTTEGLRIFNSMSESYNINPCLEHLTCVVDLLSRTGHLLEAEALIEKMKMEGDKGVFGALLNGCSVWKDVEIGERVAAKMVRLEPGLVSPYVMMSNIYAGLGRWGEKMKVRRVLKGFKVKKEPGCSWIELSKRIHVFYVEDKTHPFSDLIYETLYSLNANVKSSMSSI